MTILVFCNISYSQAVLKNDGSDNKSCDARCLSNSINIASPTHLLTIIIYFSICLIFAPLYRTWKKIIKNYKNPFSFSKMYDIIQYI